jgi:IS4 transposase
VGQFWRADDGWVTSGEQDLGGSILASRGLAFLGSVQALEGLSDAESSYRLATTILDPDQAPAKELAALYHERWEIESSFDELKTHLRGRQITLRSKTPDLVKQEFYGMMMAHFAIRGLMHEAALKEEVDPDRLSFLHAVRVIRRKMARIASIPPSAQIGIS